jgi:hypothetical protein
VRRCAPSAIALVLVAASSLSGCERKAPGPEECRSFALSAAGVVHRDELAAPRVYDKVEELTRECLTEPYDRELLRCYETTGQARVCQLEFRIRQRSR